MILFCPSCKGKLKPSGGVRLCINCGGKYYILETQVPQAELEKALETKKSKKAGSI